MSDLDNRLMFICTLKLFVSSVIIHKSFTQSYDKTNTIYENNMVMHFYNCIQKMVRRTRNYKNNVC